MYLQKHLILVALFISLFCQILVLGALQRVSAYRFTYFYEVIRVTVPEDGQMLSSRLARYAKTAFVEMENTGSSPMPAAMTALWLVDSSFPSWRIISAAPWTRS